MICDQCHKVVEVGCDTRAKSEACERIPFFSCGKCGGGRFTEEYINNPYGHDCGQRIVTCSGCGTPWSYGYYDRFRQAPQPNEDLQRAIERKSDGRYADRLTENLFRAYVDDRVGNSRREGMRHAQIEADGVYGALVTDFGVRYSLEQSAYLDAMKERDRDPHRDRGGIQTSPYGHSYLAGR